MAQEVAGSSPVYHPISLRGRAVAARQAHNLKVVGSIPSPATTFVFVSSPF